MLGELSVSCAYPTFLCRGGAVRADPDPIKPFKINRVPEKPHICSGLASRMKRPAKLPVNSVWRMSRGLCNARKPSCATRCVYLRCWLDLHNYCTIVFLYVSILAIIGWAF